VRIVAGEWRGRRIEAPSGTATRPTQDRVREALFSSLTSLLGPGLRGVRVLDAFAGSGALGLEALSRGASSAVFVECDRSARDVLAANVSALGASERARIVAGDAFALAARGALPGGPYGLILLDPPYRIDAARVADLLERSAATGAASGGAVAVWEHATDVPVTWPDGFDLRSSRRYGSTTIDIACLQMGRQA
jgi:16S rRNA (guanine966-N2)-methyltransferase